MQMLKTLQLSVLVLRCRIKYRQQLQMFAIFYKVYESNDFQRASNSPRNFNLPDSNQAIPRYILLSLPNISYRYSQTNLT